MDEITIKFGIDKMPLDTLINNAHDELSRLCGGGRWQMSIPIRPSDSDIVLHEAIGACMREIERMRAITAEINDKPCEWTHEIDYDSDVWETACGHALVWDEGTPKESGYRYCPFCRREIIESETDMEGGTP